MAARKVYLENSTAIRFNRDSVNPVSQSPQVMETRRKVDFEEALYGGVSYITSGHHQPAAKWIVAWRVSDNKVFTKILGAGEAFNWNDINDELDEDGKTVHTSDALGLKSEVKIVKENESATISAKLSRAAA